MKKIFHSICFYSFIFTFFPFTLMADVKKTSENFYTKLAKAAFDRTKENITYDPRYFSISYPMGDIPGDLGVCTDLVIRSYREMGIDLQKEVHEDMKKNFSKYPRNWHLKKTDTNIDHRRVPNLQTFFTRKGEKLEVTYDANDYKIGDIVTWNIGYTPKLSKQKKLNIPHIGIVSDKKSVDGKRPLIIHNIGQGPALEDMLFDYKITGHYRYNIKTSSN